MKSQNWVLSQSVNKFLQVACNGLLMWPKVRCFLEGDEDGYSAASDRIALGGVSFQEAARPAALRLVVCSFGSNFAWCGGAFCFNYL